MLLEREGALHELHGALATARAGAGRLALVTGEAGAGKTSVIREFLARAAGPPHVLAGGCDPLSAPRPLGPLIDAATAIDPELADRLAAGMSRAEALAAALALVDGSTTDRPVSVFVIEDVHWADDATLDLITFLGRRIDALPTLFVLSYRDDEVDAHHPLRPRLGELTASIGCRVRLAPLSLAAVAELAAGSGLDPMELHRTTGGNAFYVTEVLGGDGALPESVRDAVLARAARLAPDARTVLDAAAVVPGRVERWLLDAIDEVGHAGDGAALDACCERGLLQVDGGGAIAFRHELARIAIESELPPARRMELHSRALEGLRRPPHGDPDDARLAYHAVEADDPAAVLRHAPVAAAEASRMAAHREAERHLSHAVRFADRLDPRARADLLFAHATELMLLSRYEESLVAWERAVELYRTVGAIESAAMALAMMSRPLTALGRQERSHAQIDEAARLLDGDSPSSALALISTYLAADHMLARRFAECEQEAARAISLAEQVGDDDVLAEACIQTGIALAMAGDPAGLSRIRRGMDIARATGNDHMVVLGYSQIGSGHGEIRRYDVALPALREGVEFGTARETFGQVQYLRAWLARCELEVGRWDAAAAIAGDLLRNPRCVGISRFVSLVTVGWMRMRRGDPDVAPLLSEGLELARSTRHLQRLWPIAACRAEAAWLGAIAGDEVDLVDEAAELAAAIGWRPAIEELAHWRAVLTGSSSDLAGDPATPFGHSAAGRWDAAVAAWDAVGCPYEAAMARFHLGTQTALRDALATFDEFGARPMRARAADALRALGAVAPRGPTERTRRNPGGLTDRELEVLALVATGATNRQIATGLGVSAKTVGHHVSHILAKLQVVSRAEAAVEATRLGLVEPSADRPRPT